VAFAIPRANNKWQHSEQGPTTLLCLSHTTSFTFVGTTSSAQWFPTMNGIEYYLWSKQWIKILSVVAAR
jgi:hypothetical protein